MVAPGKYRLVLYNGDSDAFALQEGEPLDAEALVALTRELQKWERGVSVERIRGFLGKDCAATLGREQVDSFRLFLGSEDVTESFVTRKT